MRWTIRRKLTLYISIPLLLTYIVLLTWDFYRQAADARRLMQDLALERANQFAAVFNGRLEGVARIADSLASSFAARPNMLQPAAQATLFGGLRRDDWVAAITVAVVPAEGSTDAPTGYLLRRQGGLPRAEALPPGEDSTLSDWYVAVAADSKPHWLRPRLNRILSAAPVFTYAVPIIEGDRLHGVVAVHVPASAFAGGRPQPGRRGQPPQDALQPAATTQPTTTSVPTAVAKSLSALQPARYVILTPEGHLIYRSRTVDDGRGEEAIAQVRRIDAPRLTEAMEDAAAGEASVVRLQGVGAELGGEPGESAHWVAFTPIPANGWVFASAVAEDDIMYPVVIEIERRGAVLLLGTVLLGVIVYMVAIRISRPIEQMAHVARRVSQGDLDARVVVGRGRNELTQLATVFNAMVQHIRVQMEHIRTESAAREAVESELRIARDIQADLLPRTFPPFPDHAEFGLHAMIVPARHVAGDFFFTRDDCLTLVIADVSGKGVPAALLMAVTRTIIRNFAGEGLSPVDIIRRANTMLVQDSSASMFVTIFLAQYQPSTGVLTYVNAGHPSPLSLLPDGTCSDYGSSTAPLVGVLCEWPDAEFTQATRQLQIGESLVLYTDGVTEARDSQNKLFGDDGLCATLAAHGADSAEMLCHRMVDVTAEYQAGRQADDITVLVLQRKL